VRGAGNRGRETLGTEIRAGTAAGFAVHPLRLNPGQRSLPSQRRGAQPSPSQRAALADLRRETLQPTTRPAWRVRGAERGGAGRPAAPSGDPAARPGLDHWWPPPTPQSVAGMRYACALVCGVRAPGYDPGVRPRVRGAWVWASALLAPLLRAGDPAPWSAPVCRRRQPGRGCAGAGLPLEGGPPAGLPL
jgi:hypothetical protein